MFDMMNKMRDMQNKMQEAQEKLGENHSRRRIRRWNGKSKGERKKELLSVVLEPELLKPEDAKITQDLIVAAVNNALRNVEEEAKAEMAKVTDGLLPKIPGFDLDSLFKK